MAKIRIGATTTQGVYENVVLNIGREVKVGIGYVTDTRLEQSRPNAAWKHAPWSRLTRNGESQDCFWAAYCQTK